MEYLVAAYTVIWLITFAFIVSMAARQRQLYRQIEELRRHLDRDVEREG